MTFYPFIVSVLGANTGIYTPFKVLKEIILVALFLLLYGYAFSDIKIRHLILSDRLNISIILYLLITLIFTFITLQSNELEAAVSGFFMNTRFLIIFMTIQVIHILLNKRNLEKLLHNFIKVFLFLSVVISILGIMQVTILPQNFFEKFGYNGVTTPPPYLTLDSNIDVLRAFSTMWAPNTLGSFLLLPFAIFFILFLQNYKNIYASLGAIITFSAIFTTHSRSAIFAAFLAIVIILIFQKKQYVTQYLKVFLLSIALATGIGLYSLNIPTIRLLIFHSSEGDSSLTEGSTDDHFIAIKENFLDATRHPFGQGVGTAGPSSFQLKKSEPKIAENYFIQLIQETGFVGLMLFLYISISIAIKLLTKSLKNDILIIALFASFISINFVNLFLHGWADDPTSIVWWGIAAIGLYFKPKIAFGKSTLQQ